MKLLTPKQIMTAGRPSERRKRPTEESGYTQHQIAEVSIEDLEESARDHSPHRDYSMYEAQFAVMTPGYM